MNTNVSETPTEIVFYTQDEINDITNKIKEYINYGEKHYEDFINKYRNESDVLTKQMMITALISLDAKQNNFGDDFVNAYATHPPFMFYTNENHNAIRRIYGFMKLEDGTINAYAVSAMSFINNDVIGGIPLGECVRVKSWSTDQLNYLNSGLIRGKEAFIEIDGYMAFAI
jgi:hypothetical protein